MPPSPNDYSRYSTSHHYYHLPPLAPTTDTQPRHHVDYSLTAISTAPTQPASTPTRHLPHVPITAPTQPPNTLNYHNLLALIDVPTQQNAIATTQPNLIPDSTAPCIPPLAPTSTQSLLPTHNTTSEKAMKPTQSAGVSTTNEHAAPQSVGSPTNWLEN